MIKLTDIDSTQTSIIMMDNIQWYTNPILETIVSIDGRMYNPYTKKYVPKNNNGLFTVVLFNKYQTSSRYDTLLSRLLGLSLKKGQSFALKDSTKGYVKDNLITEISHPSSSKTEILSKIQDMENTLLLLKTMVIQLDEK